MRHDKGWFSKATLAVATYWQKKNARKSKEQLQTRIEP
jgi:hypothetical protein